MKFQRFKLKTCLKNSVFWDVIKGAGGVSGVDSPAMKTLHMQRQSHKVSKGKLLLMKPEVCKNNSPYERDAQEMGRTVEKMATSYRW